MLVYSSLVCLRTHCILDAYCLYLLYISFTCIIIGDLRIYSANYKVFSECNLPKATSRHSLCRCGSVETGEEVIVHILGISEMNMRCLFYSTLTRKYGSFVGPIWLSRSHLRAALLHPRSGPLRVGCDILNGDGPAAAAAAAAGPLQSQIPSPPRRRRPADEN